MVLSANFLKISPKEEKEVPQELMVDIFSRLPLSSVLRLRCLSKQWQKTLGEDYFLDLHAERSPESVLFFTVQSSLENARTQGKPVMSMSCLPAVSETPPVHSIIRLNGGARRVPSWNSGVHYMPSATCNGLMCVLPSAGFCDQRPIMVCNPITAEYITLPHCDEDGFLPCSVGLGYSPFSKQYKVAYIRMRFGCRHRWPGEVRVHTLGADTGWRKVHVDMYFQREYGGGICVDGKMYWVIYGHSPHYVCQLLSFNVETEEVTRTDINFPTLRPACIPMGYYRLVPLGGRHVSMVTCDRSMCIGEWVMLSNCTWRLRRRFDLRQCCRPNEHPGWILAIARISGNGDMMILFEDMTVHIYNGRIASTRPGPHQYPGESFGRSELLDWSVCGGYKPSLISLKPLKRRTRKRKRKTQKGERLVGWDQNLLPLPDIGFSPLMEPPLAANSDDGGTAETSDVDGGGPAETRDNDEEPMPINHHNNPAKTSVAEPLWLFILYPKVTNLCKLMISLFGIVGSMIAWYRWGAWSLGIQLSQMVGQRACKLFSQRQ